MRFKTIYTTVLLLILLTYSETLICKVIGVSDGDTITILKNSETFKVRLHGIDCPEKSQAFGTKAKQFTSDFVYGKNVHVIIHDKDRYGRLVAEVLTDDGQSLNKELVKAGFAWWYQQYAPKDSILKNAEINARKGKAKRLISDKNVILGSKEY